MTYFTEIDWSSQAGGRITVVQAGSVADEIGVMPDDQLLAVVTSIFELDDFKTIMFPDGSDPDLHSQRLILRKV